MKNILKYLLSSVGFMVVLASCKKDEHKIYYEGGTAPALTAAFTTTSTLDSTHKNDPALKLSWTNPDYQFTTGVSSHDVTYYLQVDTTGSNFTYPNKLEVSISKDLSVNYTVKELNGLLSRMNLLEDIPHNMEFRIKATLDNNSVPLYSNVIKQTITPYLDVVVPLPPTGDLYITGNAMASDWTNSPPANQKMTKVSKVEYTITVPLVSGKQYKFLSTPGQWQPQYGGKDKNGGDLAYNMGLPGQSDPDAIPTPDAAGNYKITVNFKTGKYTVDKQ